VVCDVPLPENASEELREIRRAKHRLITAEYNMILSSTTVIHFETAVRASRETVDRIEWAKYYNLSDYSEDAINRAKEREEMMRAILIMSRGMLVIAQKEVERAKQFVKNALRKRS